MLHDFSTHSRSLTLPGPTDEARTLARVARSLLAEMDTTGGVRLLGVGVSGLADWIQDELFSDPDRATDQEASGPTEPDPEPDPETATLLAGLDRRRRWWPGMDVEHREHGRGWVWGSGRGVVTVRFETAETPPGRVLSLAADDPDLSPVSYAPEA